MLRRNVAVRQTKNMIQETKGGGSATVVASYKNDLQLALSWAQLNKEISSSSELKKVANGYQSTVKLTNSKGSLEELLKARYGVFIKVA